MMNQQHTPIDQGPSEENLKRALIEQMRADLAGNAAQQQEFEGFDHLSGDDVSAAHEAKDATPDRRDNEPQPIYATRSEWPEKLWFKPLHKLWRLLTLPVADRL